MLLSPGMIARHGTNHMGTNHTVGCGSYSQVAVFEKAAQSAMFERALGQVAYTEAE